MQIGSCVPLFMRVSQPSSKARDDAVTLPQSLQPWETRFSLLSEIIYLEYLRMDFDNWIILSRKRLCDFTGVSMMQG